MKKTRILIIVIFISATVFAQHKKPNREKMDALRIAHITSNLDLTQSEAQAFWPVYNENENNRRQFREAKKLNHDEIINLTDAEAEIHLKKMMALEEQKEKQEKLYLKKLIKVLPAKKILLLKNSDHSFRRKVLEQLRQRRNTERKERSEKMKDKRSEIVKERKEKIEELKNKRKEKVEELKKSKK